MFFLNFFFEGKNVAVAFIKTVPAKQQNFLAV